MSRSKKIFLLLVLIVVTFPYVYDFIHEVSEEKHDDLELIFDAVIMLIALIGIGFLVREIWLQNRTTETLRYQLNTAHKDLLASRANVSELSAKLKQASQQYSQVVQEQFTAWDLTPSEREVALLLLKGLSFDEIAAARDTREKTVRQQATSIYRKSSLSSRYELAAWFFEDFLQ